MKSADLQTMNDANCIYFEKEPGIIYSIVPGLETSEYLYAFTAWWVMNASFFDPENEWWPE